MPSRCALFQCSLFLAKCRAVLDNHSTPFAVRQSRFPSECYQKNGSSSTCGENKKRTGHHVVCRCECRLDCQVSLHDCRQVPRTNLSTGYPLFLYFILPYVLPNVPFILSFILPYFLPILSFFLFFFFPFLLPTFPFFLSFLLPYAPP